MKYSLWFIFFSGISLCCKNQTSPAIAHKLSMDSSMVIIMESTNLLSKSCLPSCWPRDSSIKKREGQYIAYIWDSTYIEHIRPRIPQSNWNKKTNFSYLKFDSSFHPLLAYLNTIKAEKINIQDVRFLSNSKIRIGLINSLKERLIDTELGYLHVSPVVINEHNDRGVFLYNLQGTFNKSWVVSIKKISGKWLIVNQYILGTS